MCTVTTFLIIVGKPASNDILLGDIKIKENAKIMMMGTCEKVIVGISCENMYYY